MRRLLPLSVLLLILALGGLSGCDTKTPGVGTAMTAPDFTLRDLNGREVTLSDYRGKIVFLNLWATWCPPCRDEIPSMERLNEVFGARDFVMLAVNVDEQAASLQTFMREHPHGFTVLHDADAKVQKLYQVFKFPETFVIGKDGIVLDHIVGARDWSSPQALQYFGKLVDGK